MKAAAAQAAGLWLHQPQHHLHRHRGVGGAAAGAQHLAAGLGGQRVGGDDHVAGREHRGAPEPIARRRLGQRRVARHAGADHHAAGSGGEAAGPWGGLARGGYRRARGAADPGQRRGGQDPSRQGAGKGARIGHVSQPGVPVPQVGSRISVLLPNRLSIRSTASAAVLLRTSSAGFSSITSRLARRPLSAIISMHNWASR